MGNSSVTHSWTEQTTFPLKVALVFNPAAGNYCPNKLNRLRQSFEDERCAVRCYDSRTFQLQSIVPDVDLICVSGGDGTIRAALRDNQASDRDTPYCIYPAGTINLLAREAGYRTNIAKFVPDLIRRGTGSRHFGGRIGSEIFLCCASVGPDSHVVASVSPRLKKRLGRLAYGLATLQLLWAWPRNRFDLMIDGAAHAAEGVFVLKARFYAGPWVLDDKASLANDRFRVLLMPKARRRDFLRLALFALFGGLFADRCWTRLDARTIDISGPVGIPIQADGDILAVTPATIAIDPRLMTFL